MAKSRKNTKSPVAAAAAAVGSADTAPACRLREISGTPDFEASSGSTVALFTHNHVGMVLIGKAEYAGQQLAPGNQAVARISLTVKPGRNTLKAVFMFMAGTMGRGELREDCGGGESHFLRALHGDEPLQVIRIIGK